MRSAIISEIYQYMLQNPESVFLVGDLGYNAVEKIEKTFGSRFVNVGIAEQNLIGIASGIALTGKKVFVYSIIPFLTMRAYEQIRNDICYHNLDVMLIGAGAGLSYGVLGPTHFAVEDIGIMRVLPNISIFSPADKKEASDGTQQLLQKNSPVYVRIGKGEAKGITDSPTPIKIGNISTIEKNAQVSIFSYGTIFKEVNLAVEMLKKKHIATNIVNVHTLKPVDSESIVEILSKTELAVVVEEHYLIGGLTSILSEIISQQKNMPRLVSISIKNEFIRVIGTQDFLRKHVGIDAQTIVSTIIKEFNTHTINSS